MSAALKSLQDSLGPRFQADDEACFAHEPAVLRAQDSATTGGDDEIRLRAGNRQGARLSLAKRVLALVPEDFEDSLAGFALYRFIGVEALPTELRRNERSSGALACAGEAGEDDDRLSRGHARQEDSPRGAIVLW